MPLTQPGDPSVISGRSRAAALWGEIGQARDGGRKEQQREECGKRGERVWIANPFLLSGRVEGEGTGGGGERVTGRKHLF